MEEIRRMPLSNAGDGVRTTTGTVYSFFLHSHAFCEMTLYEAFDGSVLLNGHEIPITVPTVVLVTPGGLHRICPPEGCTARFIKTAFDASLLPDGIDGCAVCQRLPKDGLIQRLFEELLQIQEDRHYAALLIAVILRRLGHCGLLPHPGSGQGGVALKAAALLHDRFTAPITLVDLARELAVTPQHLSRSFSAQMGLGFSAYLSELRLRRAAELLETSDLSITGVCYAAGFGDLSHFLRSFKKRFGLTPKAFRLHQKSHRSQ